MSILLSDIINKDEIQIDSTYNDKIVIPKSFMPPDWYLKAKTDFKNEVKKSFKSNHKLISTEIRKLIEDIILDKKRTDIKPHYPLHSKNIKKLINEMFKVFSNDEFLWRYALLYEMSFFLSTFKPSSFQPEALVLPKEFKIKRDIIKHKYLKMLGDGKDKAKKDRAIVWVNKEMDKLANEVIDYFRENNIKIADFVDSGAKGSVGDIRKLLVSVGLSINAKNEINDVILDSHIDGLSPTQFFNYSSQGIVSQYSKSHMTAIPGYIVRKLYTSMENIKLSKMPDCGSKKLFEFKVKDEKMLNKLKWRYYSNTPNSSLEKLDPEDKSLIGKTIYLRSPLYCQARDGICPTCFGPDFIKILNIHPGENLGLKIVGSFSESLVNNALKAAHKGLDLDLDIIDLRKDIYEYSS